MRYLCRKGRAVDCVQQEAMLNYDHWKVRGHGGVNKVCKPLAAVAHDNVNGCPGRAIRPGLLTELLENRTCPAVEVDMSTQSQVYLQGQGNHMTHYQNEGDP